ncbi:MAG: hypothetical protein Q9164_000742 [Protoblastenia rupestris]
MAPADLTDPEVIGGFEKSMETTSPHFEENPYTKFCLDRLNDRLEMQSIPVQSPAYQSLHVPRSDPNWRAKTPSNFEEVQRIQDALLPAIEDYAAFTFEPVPDWNEGDPQTIWGSYYQQHDRLQRLAEMVWNRKAKRADARKCFRLRTALTEMEIPLRYPGAPIRRLRRKPVPLLDASRVQRMLSWNSRDYRRSRLRPQGAPTKLDQANRLIAMSRAASGRSAIFPHSPVIRFPREALIEAHAAIDQACRRAISFYPDEFRAWLITRGSRHFDKKKFAKFSWQVWCKIVAPVIFIIERGIKKANELTTRMRPLFERRMPDTVTLEEARKGHRVWKSTKHIDSPATQECYPVITHNSQVVEDIMSAFAATMKQRAAVSRQKEIQDRERVRAIAIARGVLEQIEQIEQLPYKPKRSGGKSAPPKSLCPYQGPKV